MIRILKLQNGETIIGEVDDFSEFYNVYEPFDILEVDDEDYGKGFKLNYLLAFSEESSVHIRNSSVLYSYKPSKNMEEYYHKLVEYTKSNTPDQMIESAVKDMDEMDEYRRKLISRRLRGKSSLN